MDHKTFNKFRDLIYEQSGIALSEGKEALVSARVAKRLRALGLNDHESYLRHVSEDRSGEELVSLLDTISTNVTNFFREPAHFRFLENAVRHWVKQGQTRFRIWCAASSTGEEPYTLAMTMLEATAGQKMDIKILATDISTKVLRIAQAGFYEDRKVQDIPLELRRKYLDASEQNGVSGLVAKPVLREMITFRRLNLSQPPFPMKGPLDAVFCRNVMIYFDNKVRSRLISETSRLLKSGGYLMVGHSESLTGIPSTFQTIQPAVYQKP